MQCEFIDENVRLSIKKFWLDHPELGEMNFIDFETTGLSPIIHEILEIGIIKIDAEGNMTSFSELVKPLGLISAENENIHGISYKMVANALPIGQVLPRCMEFIGSTPIIGHNVQFDCGFLITQAVFQELKLQGNAVYDTCLFSRQVAKKIKRHPLNHKLTTLIQLYVKNAENRISHRALIDSLSSLEVFIQLCLKLETPQHVTELFWKKSYLYKLINNDLNLDLSYSASGMSDKEKELLLQSVKNNSPLFISYLGGSQGADLRPIRPVALLPSQKHLVLHAECLLSKQMRNFKLKQIKKVLLNENIYV